MTGRPVAVLERQGRTLLCALGAATGDRVPVVDEDGRTFKYPLDRLLWRAPTLLAAGKTDRECAAALRAMRHRLGDPPDWETLHVLADPDEPVDLEALLGGSSEEAVLAAAARAAEAGPWFRILRGRLVAVSGEEMEKERERLEEAKRREAEDEALVARLGAGGNPATGPAVPTAAVDRVLAWALSPTETNRPPAAVAASLQDPEDALDRLDAADLLPPGLVPPLARRGLGGPFPRAAMEEVPLLLAAPDPAAERRDLSAMAAWAIDDPETVEVDDAVSLERGPGGEPLLLVHVSDAAAGLPPRGAVDGEARRRAVTGYLPDRRIPMVPPELNDRRLSLVEGEPRDAVTVAVRVGADGRPEPVEFFRSRVAVTRRMDYVATARAADWPAALRPALDMVRAMLAHRVAAGARVAGLPQRYVRVRDGEVVLGSRGGGDGDLLVGESMVTFNALAARRLRDAGAPALWRCQDPPRGEPPPPEDPLYPVRMRKVFSPARLSTEPGAHAGLGLDAYLQVTSPIRRYSDLLHQRQLVAVLEGSAPPHADAEVRALAVDLARAEREMRQAEGEREAYWLCRWLEARRAETFEAVCSRAAQRGRAWAWVPALLQECPFRPHPAARAPVEGDPLRLVPGRLSRHRGRLEFDVVGV